MQRRTFLSRLSLAALAATLPVSLLTACSESIQTILNTILNALAAIIGVADPNAPWYQSLINAIAALKQAEASWQAGGAVTVIDDALNTISDILASIPLTAQYSPLIAILVAAIETVLALIPQPIAVAPQGGKGIIIYQVNSRTANPYKGMVTLNHPGLFQTRSGAVRAQWNAKADAIGLPQAKI
jgi:hypothetical protein